MGDRLATGRVEGCRGGTKERMGEAKYGRGRREGGREAGLQRKYGREGGRKRISIAPLQPHQGVAPQQGSPHAQSKPRLAWEEGREVGEHRRVWEGGNQMRRYEQEKEGGGSM